MTQLWGRFCDVVWTKIHRHPPWVWAIWVWVGLVFMFVLVTAGIAVSRFVSTGGM